MAEKTFPFMKLPPELRNKVYKNLFVLDHTITFTCHHGLQHKMVENEATSELLAMCKQVHDKALPILYGANSFMLDEICIATFSGFIGEKATACVERLSLRGDYDYTDSLEIFSDLTSLKCLDFTMCNVFDRSERQMPCPFKTPGTLIPKRQTLHLPEGPIPNLPRTITKLLLEKEGLEIHFEVLMQNHLNYWAIRHGMVHPKTRIDDVRTDRYRLAANTTAKKKGLALCFMGRTYNLAFVDS